MSESFEKAKSSVELPSLDSGFMLVGRGIQSFSSVESTLSFLFADIMFPADRLCSITAIDSTQTIRAKINLLNSVAEIALNDKDIYELIIKYTKEVDKLSTLRNKLAHWSVSHWPGIETFEDIDKIKVVLAPRFTTGKWAGIMWGNDPPLHLEEVDKFIKDCNSLFLKAVHISELIERERKSTAGLEKRAAIPEEP